MSPQADYTFLRLTLLRAVNKNNVQTLNPIGIMKNTLNKVKGGFTLIELLVVIAIIAILASLAVPAVMKARVRANITKSASNMKQIVLACKLYASDNNDSYPSTGTTAVTNFNLLIPNYAGAKTIFQVPGLPFTATPDLTLGTAENGYTYVQGLTDVDNPVNVIITERLGTIPTYGPAGLATATATDERVFGGSGVNVAKIDGSVTFAASAAGGTNVIVSSQTNGVLSALPSGSAWRQNQ